MDNVLFQERGIYLVFELDVLDEEVRYFVVRCGYLDEGDDDEDQCIDDYNDEMFGGIVIMVGIIIFQNSSSFSIVILGRFL